MIPYGIGMRSELVYDDLKGGKKVSSRASLMSAADWKRNILSGMQIVICIIDFNNTFVVIVER